MDPFELVSDELLELGVIADSWQRYTTAAHIIERLERFGFALVRKETVEGLAVEAKTALTPDQASLLHQSRS